jgi:hypothetical protein
MVRAGLVLSAAGAIGAFGACKDKGVTPPSEPPPPPPPGAPAAPINVTATPKSTSQIDVSWTDASDNEAGFKIESCSGTGCTNFAEVGSVAANTSTFANTGLTASTDYSYRVKAFNDAGSNMSSNASAKTPQPPVRAPEAVMVGAGEITSCRAGLSGQTATLVDGVIEKNPDAIVFTTGSNVSDTTTGCSYPTAWEQSGWAKFKDRMRVALTQRDYTVGTGLSGTVKTPTPDWIYSTFGDRAGQRGKSWYSFDVGQNWHVIVLNTGTWENGTGNLTDPSSPQNTWLAADLNANQRPCVMAILGHRRFYDGSGATGKNFNALQIWSLLYKAGADVVISGWDKLYERMALQDHNGNPDPKGVRQFIVGTGGRSLDRLTDDAVKFPTAEVRNASTQGVLKLTLFNDSYTWEFIPTVAGGFTDTGTTQCH